jgi:hypothetical protein
MSGENIQVVIDEDDDPAATLQRKTAELKEQADRDRAETSRLQQLNGAMEQLHGAYLTVESETRAAQTQYQSALEDGDAERATQAQTRIANAAAHRIQIAQEQQRLGRASAGDPVEQQISTDGCSDAFNTPSTNCGSFPGC